MSDSKETSAPGAPKCGGFSLLRIRRLALRRFRRDERGATAVEFGFIAVPFFMLMMATVELALMLWTSQQMEEALFEGTRVMLTGESLTKYTGTPATAAQKFKEDICANMTLLVDCTNRLKIDVKTFASFATATSAKPISAGALDTASFGWQPMVPSTIVVVRAVLSYPLVMSSWNQAFADLSDGSRALMASIAFRTEPF